jgi:predicted DNA-binding transcriptional regulator AlpA
MPDTVPQYIPASKLAAMTGESLATFYRRLSAKFYPKPIRFGSRAVRWNLATVNAYLAESERAGRLLKRDEWEAMQAVASRQEKKNHRTFAASGGSQLVRHDSRAVRGTT